MIYMSLTDWYYGYTQEEYDTAKKNVDFLEDKLNNIKKYYYEFTETNKEAEHIKMVRLEMSIKCIKYYYKL